jgi:hypothetical protein
MKQIEDSAIVKGNVVGNDLILTRFNADQINAGNVRGPQGIKGDTGAAGKDGLDGVKVVTSTTRPTNPTEGMAIYETDTKNFYTWNGTTWSLPKNVAGGVLGTPGKATADQNNITTETDLTNLSTTVTLGVARRIKISYYAGIVHGSVDGYAILRLREGLTDLYAGFVAPALSGVAFHQSGFILLTPASGIHTYKLTLERATGANAVALYARSNAPSFIVVEDVGGV